MIRRRLARSPLKPHVVENGFGLAGLGVAVGVGDFGGWVGGQFVTIRRSGTTGSGCSLIASGCWRQTRQACSVDRTSNGAMIAINCLACSSNTVSTARVHVAAEGVDLTGRQCRGGGRFGNDVVIAQETTSSNQGGGVAVGQPATRTQPGRHRQRRTRGRRRSGRSSTPSGHRDVREQPTTQRNRRSRPNQDPRRVL